MELRVHGEGRALSEEVDIDLGPIVLRGDLNVPQGARGIVLFAHGSGSGRTSSRNRYVARLLNDARQGTLLFDLLTEAEERVDRKTAHLRFDIGLLAERLVETTKWLVTQPSIRDLNIGYFGASTGAAAALVAAAELSDHVGAVVSRGGRPDLAGPALADVRAPTLLIVGGHDFSVIPLNQRALERLHCEKDLSVVFGATHLFEEPGALEEVGRLAAEWFGRWL
jgi:putative phosphoribosyl transferase